MIFEFFFDVAKLSFYVACLYAIFSGYARHAGTTWAARLSTRRMTVWGVLALTVVGIKLVEDVVAKESGPIDVAVLWFLRKHTPSALTGLFEVITLSGSAGFLVPAALLSVLLLFVTRQRFEAALMGTSTGVAALVGWGMKAVVDRPRPALWDAQWYWGSSFPSGHTLNTAAFSMAVALCVLRARPGAGALVMPLALLWTTLVAVSRLVLGVHWPSDVLAAMCLGALIPLLTSVAFELWLPGFSRNTPAVNE